MSYMSRFDQEKGCFVLKDTKPPVNAFNWRQFTDEERAARNERNNQNKIAHNRSIASTRSIERKRETQPSYGTLPINSKTVGMILQKPKRLNIHGKL